MMKKLIAMLLAMVICLALAVGELPAYLHPAVRLRALGTSAVRQAESL